MKVTEEAHFTYCTNIHPGETWEEVFDSLKEYCLAIKKRLVSDAAFGIGLRLSRISATTLLEKKLLEEFKNWLDENNMYVFTMNGFPYGDFHDTIIKDKVHKPDWRTNERITYTKDLFEILTYLLPEGMEGGISTSPLSYKLWFQNKADLYEVKKESCSSLVKIVLQLLETQRITGKFLHLDLEPEPDGLLENTEDLISFYNNFLLIYGVNELMGVLNCSALEAKNHLLNHIQVCYDVCHFSLVYEETEQVIDTLLAEGIKIGKIQISAALKCKKSTEAFLVEQQDCLRQFDEPNYLHQAVVRRSSGELSHYSDLAEGLNTMKDADFEELRTHFHVPVFVADYQFLQSTQDDIVTALEYWKKLKYCKHLEVETYTWTILPENLQTDLISSVVRELDWVRQELDK
jgi:hypothetical protein